MNPRHDYSCLPDASEFGYTSRHLFSGAPVVPMAGPVSANPFRVMDAHPIPMSQRRSRPQLEVGREMVLNREFDGTNQADSLALIHYWQSQRELVERRGQCEGGCDRTEQWTTQNGAVVCIHTFEVCPRMRLRLIVKHLSRLCA